jgi:hypothetical protein
MGRRMAELLMRLIASEDEGGAPDGEQLRPVLETELSVRSSS